MVASLESEVSFNPFAVNKLRSSSPVHLGSLAILDMTTPSANDPVVGSIQPATPAHSLTDLNNKRTAAITGDRAAPQSYKRRRAARACLSCRQRKVRCNAIDGSPCLNCRSDHLEVRLLQLELAWLH